MKVAINGCCHGALDKLYDAVLQHDRNTGTKTKLLICCGDFQCTRTAEDLSTMACPAKYRRLADFPKYFTGQRCAPVLTIFIGGNHEASHMLRQLRYGGWVAPNIFFLGQSGVVRVGSSVDDAIRLGGLSGIFKPQDYFRGYYEVPPYSESSIRSMYHVRRFEVDRLKKIQQPLDIMLSHDWPQGIEKFGNTQLLLQQKPFFAEEVKRNCLGSPPAWELLADLQPRFWFSGHLHVKFEAIVPHHAAVSRPRGFSRPSEPPITRFVATDKPLPGRHFLHFEEIYSTIGAAGGSAENDDVAPSIFYDLEWLAIIQANHFFTPTESSNVPSPLVVDPGTAAMACLQQRLLSRGEGFKWPTWDELTCHFTDLAAQQRAFLDLLSLSPAPVPQESSADAARHLPKPPFPPKCDTGFALPDHPSGLPLQPVTLLFDPNGIRPHAEGGAGDPPVAARQDLAKSEVVPPHSEELDIDCL